MPRYTSYPTAPNFSPEVDCDTYRRWLSEIPAGDPVSLYVHIPFCTELCWFCACRTQGTRRYKQVQRYLSHLVREIGMVAEMLGPDRPISQLHFGGGSPTILEPMDLHGVFTLLSARFPGVSQAEIAVEIDPRDMTEAKLDALAECGLGRASIGVQDFDERVQQAIGRIQGWELTRDVIAGLRMRGVRGINIDLLYGLPLQTTDSLAATLARVIELKPDRIALFGYAHVPWMAKRQKLIDAEALPSPDLRQRQATLASDLLQEAGYKSIGIDHFARVDDPLARSAREQTLKRNFQGYTVDSADALVGLGASAISSLPQGYAQNAPSTAGYQTMIEAAGCATSRGHHLTLDDRVRRDVIQQVLCQFRLDFDQLKARYGDFADGVIADARKLAKNAPLCALIQEQTGLSISPKWRAHARLIAAEFDTYLAGNATRHSLAI